MLQTPDNPSSLFFSSPVCFFYLDGPILYVSLASVIRKNLAPSTPPDIGGIGKTSVLKLPKSPTFLYGSVFWKSSVYPKKRILIPSSASAPPATMDMSAMLKIGTVKEFTVAYPEFRPPSSFILLLIP